MWFRPLSAGYSYGVAGPGAGSALARMPQRAHHRCASQLYGLQSRRSGADPTCGKIYYPTAFYADLFDAMGKATFPSYHTYKCVQDKIKQSALFQLVGLPHPKTRVFYGKRQQLKIKRHFQYPFIAKEPRGSAMGRGVFLIENDADLEHYTQGRHVCYIQQYLTIDRDIRAVVIGSQVAHAYWRIAKKGEFRTNVARGGRISLEPIPKTAMALAIHGSQNLRVG